MANGNVEIHDPFSNLTTGSNSGPKSTSDSNSMADTVELRLVMAYANRRRPKRDFESTAQDSPTALNADTNSEGPSSSKILAKTKKEAKEKKSKKKRRAKGLLGILACIKPRTKEQEPLQVYAQNGVTYRGGDVDDDVVKEDDKLDDVVSRLTEIADEIPFTPPELQFDSEDDAVEKVIGLLLRETGDRLNQQELLDAGIATELFWNYGFFETLIKTFLIRMGLMTSEPNALGPQASPVTQIAMTCEVTSRLSALDTLPMSRMLDHGARYLQVHHSAWAQQHGGYEEAFYSDNEDEGQ